MSRVVFLGTPEAAVPTLIALAKEAEIGLVVTQPDRPRGRSGAPAPPPVKETAVEAGWKVAQPDSAAHLLKVIDQTGPFDVGVVVAYGRILRPEVLALPRCGYLNVHFSLLPRWRGAAPVARALMAGDTMTGVTIIRLDEGMDSGPVLTAQAVDIHPGETAGELTTRLARLGASLLTRAAIGPYLAGDLEPVPQVDEGVTYAEKISPEDRILDVGSTADEFVNRVRALAPSPAATLEIDGARHKILAARAVDTAPPPRTWQEVDGAPVVAIGSEGVELVRLQPPGRNPQSGRDWVRGRRRRAGEVG